jgi:DNA-binding NarL/FixJ family response regulator
MILVCSPDKKIRQRWRQGLDESADVHEVDSVEGLEQGLMNHKAELVLLHLSLPDLNGTEGVASLRRKYPAATVMVFSDVPEEKEGINLFASGVSAYANTYMSPVLLTEAVKVVQLGEIWVGKKLMQSIIANLARLTRAQGSESTANALSLLTEREQEIAKFLAEGASNKVIASRIGVTERTVKAHLTSIFRKTGATDRLQLALLIHGQAN